MIRLSVLYPAEADTTFNHDYYRDHHVPMCVKAWNVKAEIDKGVNGPYVGAVHLFFDSLDAMNAALGSPDTAAIMADIANYTNKQPVMQISEVV